MASLVNREALIAKRQHIEGQLASLRAGERITKRIGGATIVGRSKNIAVQQARLDHIDWLLSASDKEVIAKMVEQTDDLGELIDVDSVGGALEPDVLLAKGLAELTQMGLGIHRAQQFQAQREGLAVQAKAQLDAVEEAVTAARVEKAKGKGQPVADPAKESGQ